MVFDFLHNLHKELSNTDNFVAKITKTGDTRPTVSALKGQDVLGDLDYYHATNCQLWLSHFKIRDDELRRGIPLHFKSFGIERVGKLARSISGEPPTAPANVETIEGRSPEDDETYSAAINEIEAFNIGEFKIMDEEIIHYGEIIFGIDQIQGAVQLVVTEPPSEHIKVRPDTLSFDYEAIDDKEVQSFIGLCSKLLKPNGKVFIIANRKMYHLWESRFHKHLDSKSQALFETAPFPFVIPPADNSV